LVLLDLRGQALDLAAADEKDVEVLFHVVVVGTDAAAELLVEVEAFF
jgi:hypothetical protein